MSGLGTSQQNHCQSNKASPFPDTFFVPQKLDSCGVCAQIGSGVVWGSFQGGLRRVPGFPKLLRIRGPSLSVFTAASIFSALFGALAF